MLRPFWTLERKAEAEASVQKFVDLTNRVFAGQATRSLKFTCLSLVTDALEVATRLKNFLGKDHPPVPIELLAKPGQWQVPLGQQSPYVTTGGNENNVVLRVHFPRKMSARTGKGACASVQVNMCRGQPGARSVTVKGAMLSELLCQLDHDPAPYGTQWHWRKGQGRCFHVVWSHPAYRHSLLFYVQDSMYSVITRSASN